MVVWDINMRREIQISKSSTYSIKSPEIAGRIPVFVPNEVIRFELKIGIVKDEAARLL